MPDTQSRFIINPDRLFSTWNIADLYAYVIWPTGESYITSTLPARHVPNENDMVVDWNSGVYRVSAVDYTTGVATLKPWEFKTSPNDITEQDVLLGTGPGYISESYRMHVDKRTVPYVVNLDGRLRFYHPTTAYIKVFRGSDIDGQRGELVGVYYTSAGADPSENIPLAAVPDPGRNGTAKAPVSFNTHYDLKDGELVTAVAYSDTGHKVSHAMLLVAETSLVRPVESGYKYVSGVRIISPFLSKSEPNVLLFPLNINTNSVPLMGVVEYSDGSTSAPEPISRDGGSRFSLFGLGMFIPTLEGYNTPMTLNYVMRDNEYSYIQGPTANGSVTERYIARTTRIEGAYSLKLYVYPRWSDALVGYDLEFFLYNLDRNVFHPVPKDKVRITDGYPLFDGLNFLTRQRLAFSVNLKDIDPQYNEYHHTQVVDVSLISTGTEHRDNWEVNYNPDGDVKYGRNSWADVRLIDANNHTVDLTCGKGSLSQWLEHLYYSVLPIYNQWKESGPLTPDMFVIRTKRRRVEYSISRWNERLQIVNDLAVGETIYIEWIQRTVNGDLQLGITGLPVRIV
jgi:hypothetical protein